MLEISTVAEKSGQESAQSFNKEDTNSAIKQQIPSPLKGRIVMIRTFERGAGYPDP